MKNENSRENSRESIFVKFMKGTTVGQRILAGVLGTAAVVGIGFGVHDMLKSNKDNSYNDEPNNIEQTVTNDEKNNADNNFEITQKPTLGVEENKQPEVESKEETENKEEVTPEDENNQEVSKPNNNVSKPAEQPSNNAEEN